MEAARILVERQSTTVARQWCDVHGRGIGRAAALLFAQSGAKVVIGDIDPSSIETDQARGGRHHHRRLSRL